MLDKTSSLFVKSSSWETTCLLAMGAAAGVGASALLFAFRNVTGKSQKLIPVFCIVGGAGLGGWGSSVVIPSLNRPDPIPLTPIGCNRPFSIANLDGSASRVSFAGLGLMIGYSYLRISAYERKGIIFDRQDISGPGFTSASIGIFTGVGVWRQWATSDKKLQEQAAKILKGTPHATITQGG